MKVEMDIYSNLEEAEAETNEKLEGKRNARVYVKIQGDGRVFVILTYMVWGSNC